MGSRTASKAETGATALASLVADLEAFVNAATPEDLPEVRGALARLDTVAVLRAGGAAAQGSQASEGPDRLLTADELAKRLGKSVWWVYKAARRPNALPFRRDLDGGRYGFSERGLNRWLSHSR